MPKGIYAQRLKTLTTFMHTNISMSIKRKIVIEKDRQLKRVSLDRQFELFLLWLLYELREIFVWRTFFYVVPITVKVFFNAECPGVSGQLTFTDFYCFSDFFRLSVLFVDVVS